MVEAKSFVGPTRVVALVGPGRAGTAIAVALQRQGWTISAVAGREVDSTSTRAAATLFAAPAKSVEAVGAGASLVIIATPDAAIAATATRLAPALESGALVVHLSGARGLAEFDALTSMRPDVRVGGLHPLQSLPTAAIGADRLAEAWCAVAGPESVADLAVALGMHPFVVAEHARATYHAAACIASNHLVALLGQVERIAESADVPFDAFVPLMRATLDNVAALGAGAALTGPIARGDASTVAAHLDALPSDERTAYRALAELALRLVGRDDAELRAILSEVSA